MEKQLQLIISSPSKESLEKAINKFYYSSSYEIVNNKLYNSKGIVKDTLIENKGKRWKFYFLN